MDPRVFLINLSQRVVYCGLVLLGGLILYWILNQLFSLYPGFTNPFEWLLEQFNAVEKWLVFTVIAVVPLLAEFGSIAYSMFNIWKLPKVTKEGQYYFKEARSGIGRRKRLPASKAEILAYANLRIIRDKLDFPETMKTDLFVQLADSPNAYTLGLETPLGGRHAICLHSALLSMSSANVAAVLAHELGHVKNQDTATKLFMRFFRNLVSFVIFAPVYLVYSILWVLSWICAFIPLLRIFAGLFLFMLSLLIGCVRVLERLVMWPADWYGRSVARRSEYRADAVAARCVGPLSICRALFLLSKQSGTSREKRLLAVVDQLKILHATHPAFEDRIRAVQERAYAD